MSASKVLIVEDELIVSMDLQITTEQLGYTVVDRVVTGEDAIEFIKQNTVDIIFMDVILKGKINGIETAEKIHSFLDVPIIFISANNDTKKLVKDYDISPSYFIKKPFDEKELKITIEEAIKYKNLN